jgi:predicted AlkP superfamily phosphohydrolase/phosphomutase
MNLSHLISFAGALASGLLLSTCTQPKAEPVARVLFVGADGLEWNVLRPLLRAGKCPNLRALMERGTYGHLGTLVPTLSPILWTSIATGKMPEQHGIHGFTDQDLKQYTSAQRQGRAVWNIAGQYGLSSNVFGWWITWPAEEILGMMVSGSSSSALVDANWKPSLLPGLDRQVFPADRTQEVMAIADEAGSQAAVQKLAERIFGADPRDLGAVERDLIQQTLWSIQADATFCEIAKRMIRAHPADLDLIYFGGTDVIAHRFWRYYEPRAFAWPDKPGAEEAWKKMSPSAPALKEILANPAGERALARAIPNYYEWFDEMLGQLIAAAGPGATVIVASDHGFHASSTAEPNPKFITGHHQDGPPGVIIASGPGIARLGGAQAFVDGDAIRAQGNILDLEPTLLALLGIPSSRGLPERADASLLDGRARTNGALPLVDSHDTGFRAPHKLDVPKEMEEAYLKKFRGLGYIGLEGSDKRAPALVDPKGFEPDTHSPIDAHETVPTPKK